jgi:CheY-like chemotaxis protein
MTVWVDQKDLGIGSDIPSTINKGLENADIFLLLYSSSAAASKWVAKEWSSAIMRSLDADESSFKIVIGCLDSTRIPPVLAGMKSVDLYPDIDKGLRQITAALGAKDVDRPSVWYYDDEQICLDAFEQRHGNTFNVTSFHGATQLLASLMSSLRDNSLPDVLLLDFHMPRSNVSPEKLETARNAVTNLVDTEHELRKEVDRAWHPAGVDIVEMVRSFYSPEEVPIAMHTQQGLILLRDDLLQQLEYLNVGWLIKNRFSAETDRMVLDGIARRSGHQITRKRPRALIVDDNPNYIASFVERQRDYYDIESIYSEDAVMGQLAKMEKEGGLPDIFLVDMYYPTGNETPELIEHANQKLHEFAIMENETQQLVREAFTPMGISLLRQVRKIIPASRLPMVMYTTSGLVTVGDQEFREVQNRGCGWLLKNRYDERTEEVLILGQMMHES